LYMQFWSACVVPRYLNFATSSKGLFAIFMHLIILSNYNHTT
jgi:hypothetical protein